MSVKLMSQVWELDLPQNEKLVLLALADHCNDEGLCYPSVPRIAWKCNYSDRGVQLILGRLKVAGLVKVVANEKGGRGRVPVYSLHLEKGELSAPFISERVNQEVKRVNPGALKGEPASSPESSVTVINRGTLLKIAPHLEPACEHSTPVCAKCRKANLEKFRRETAALRKNGP